MIVQVDPLRPISPETHTAIQNMVWKFDGSSWHHRTGSPVLAGCRTKGLEGVSNLLRRMQMNWTSQFLPKEGYWLKRNADGTEELVWLYNVSGVWCAASKSGFSGFRTDNGVCIADDGVQFKGPYIF